MKPLLPVFYLLIILLPQAATSKSVDQITLARAASTTAKPPLPISYFNSPCQASVTGYVTCGEEFCELERGHITSFRSQDSRYSFSYEYNLSAYLQFHNPKSDYCVDYVILNDSKSGYRFNELDDVPFVGILKIIESMSRNVRYVPFKTRLNAKEINKDKAVYDMIITNLWNLTPLKDTPYTYAALSWLTFRKSLNQVIKSQTQHTSGIEKVKLPQSSLTLTLNHSWNLSGKVYDASLTGEIKTPYGNIISSRYDAKDIRFARPGFNSFRKDYRYKRSVSMLPDIREYYKMENELYQIIEIVLMPEQ
ncbi:hypothetical protein NX722_12470 [Endozoicomonas gorgoniicola]|uniref:Uncharacterized protein n=1 Tax=Endozoicomonas gorgoniicola TaxID=1234144 RepID=A0ABT3MVN3_9GAMM|nr:hypothetical protein [Endozoicomonas gorgoniicola]MCW7553434.1 hypothetical protein [Endozoicomonas gorgoniicola]